MALTFDCPVCDRSYSVDDALAGKKARCKGCGTEMRVPPPAAGAKSAPKPKMTPTPRPKSGPAPGPGVDLYGLDEGSPARTPRGAGRDDEASAPVAPRRAGAGTGKKARRRKAEGPEGERPVRKLALFILGFGVVAYLMPEFGLVLRPRGGRGFDPVIQQAFGLFSAAFGAVLLGLTYAISGLWSAFGGSPWLRRLSWAATGVFAVAMPLIVAIALINGPGRVRRLGGAGAIASRPASHALRECEPRSDAQFELSGGVYVQGSMFDGRPSPFFWVNADYTHLGGTVRPGEYLILVVASPRDRIEIPDAIDPSPEPQGTVFGSRYLMAPDPGPHSAWMEVACYRGLNGKRKKVSESIPLRYEVSDAYSPEPPASGPAEAAAERAE